MTEEQLDREYEVLASPQPRVLVQALVNNPNYVKCPRCWHYHSILLNYDSLCDRCCNVLETAWPDHESVPFIKAAREAQIRHFSRGAK